MRSCRLVRQCLLCAPGLTAGATPATDSAADQAYDSGWTDGSNGGSGWGVPPSGRHDRVAGPAAGGRELCGLFRTGRGRRNQLAPDARRPRVRHADQWLHRWEITHGVADYFVFDYAASSSHYWDTDVPTTDQGVHCELTLLDSSGNYILAITPLTAGAVTTPFGGALVVPNQLELYHVNEDPGAPADANDRWLYFNNIGVVPEPGALVTLIRVPAIRATPLSSTSMSPSKAMVIVISGARL